MSRHDKRYRSEDISPVMFRTHVPVQGFDEGSFCRTVRALPWLVVAVVPVHVVHKTPEAPALFAAEHGDENSDNVD